MPRNGGGGGGEAASSLRGKRKKVGGGGRKTRKGKDSDFVTSAPCNPDAEKSPKTQNNLWRKDRLIDLKMFLKNILAVLVAVV